MSKAMFGIAATLALAISPARAGDEAADEKATGATVASVESKTEGEGEKAARPVVEAGSESGAVMESKEVRTSFEERWLRDREGLRDGGY